MPIRPIEIKCGQLITNAAPEDIGIKNYATKLDFRRIAPDRDARREGFVPFQPNQAHATTPANLPTTGSGSPSPVLTKIAQVRAGNGKVAVIAANSTTIYRYFSLEVGDYFVGDGTPQSYFVETGANTPYFQESFNDWVQIGANFSQYGTYWEAVQVNNTLILNNGIDLPVSFNVEDQSVTPLYELRDQGIASVGTIWEYNGILMLGNVVEINNTPALGQTTDPLTTLMNSANPYGRYSTADPSTSGLTAQQIQQNTNQFQYRVIWSMPGEPTRFAASVPCSVTAGTRTLILNWPSLSFSNGQQILILGAGADGGNLSATILWINPSNGAEMYLDTTILTTVSDTTVQSLDSVGSIVGYEDLDDDGSAVIRGAAIMTSVAIYKDTSIFICNYTGATGAPFTFQRVYQGVDSIYYRNTLVSVVHNWQSWHFFIGRNCLFKFDLINLTPTPVYKEIENLFFGNEENLLSSPSLVWAADNPVTNEIFISNPGASPNTMVCLDYKYNTASTSSVQASCGSVVQYPTASIPLQGVAAFLMGDLNNLGAVIQYGRKDDGSAPVFSRCTGTTQGTPYSSILASGVSAIDSSMNDTYVNGYELRTNNLTGRVTLALVGGSNPASATALWSVDRTAAGGATPALFVPCGNLAQTFGDSVTVYDANVQCEVTKRTLLAGDVGTMGAGRN